MPLLAYPALSAYPKTHQDRALDRLLADIEAHPMPDLDALDPLSAAVLRHPELPQCPVVASNEEGGGL